MLAELGSGSSGTVYRARLTSPYADQPVGTEVAVKFLRQDRLHDEKARARFHAEGALGQQVQHRNVAAIHGIETISVLGMELTYLVMELVQGTTLRAYLKQQGPPVEDLTRRIGADAASGLAALHKRAVVHRDLKPENLVLTPDSEVKIVDLGLARPFGAVSAANGSGRFVGSASSYGHGIGGTVAYAAPEALRGNPASPKSDLYALGVVLYEVATGRHPFAHCTTADDMIHAQLYDAPPRPSHLRPRMSALLEQLLLELLRKDPDQRPRDAAEIARILATGEASDWWRKHEQRAPALASARRLQRMRRPADTTFHGRADELQQLDKLLDRARKGQGQVLCITGPAGIGRRRLIDEAMTRWLERGRDLLFLGGEADPDLGRGEPFAGSVLDWLLRGDDRDAPHAATRAEARARAELQLGDADAQALIAVATGQSQEPPEVRSSRLAAALLAAARKDRVLVLRVAAADRLDTSAKLVLQRLVQGCRKSHVLLLLTAGPDGLPPSQQQELQVPRLDLHGLDEATFVAFGRALFRGAQATGDRAQTRGDDVPDPQQLNPQLLNPQLATLLTNAHTTFSGSPGNLIEALDHLAQQGLLQGRAGDYHGLAADAELRPAPRHLLRFEQRVASLSQEQRRVLAATAVLGMRCELADLTELAAVKPLAALETLSLFRGRVVRAQGGTVEFRHRDFQKALLQQLPADERTALHRRAADLLTARGRPPLQIGLQFSQALDHERAIAPLLQGLEQLVRTGSRRTSQRIAARLRVHFQSLGAAAQQPRHEAARLQLLLLWGRARQAAAQPEQAALLFAEADALARRLDDRLGVGAALSGLASASLDQGHLVAAISLLENAHRELDEPATVAAASGDAVKDAPVASNTTAGAASTGGVSAGGASAGPTPPFAADTARRARSLAASAHALHSRILLYQGLPETGLKHVQAALRHLPPDDVDLRCHFLIDLARLEALLHHYPTALKTLARVEQEKQAQHLPRVRMRLHLYRGQIRALLGDDDSTQDLRLCAQIAEQLSLPAYASRAHVFLGERAFFLGNDDEARRSFAQARALAAGGVDRLGGTLAEVWLYRLGEDLGELPDQVDALNLPELSVALLVSRSQRAQELGDAGAAQAFAHAALQIAEQAVLPLPQQLRVLTQAGRDVQARALVRAISERQPDRRSRKRLLAAWERGARA